MMVRQIYFCYISYILFAIHPYPHIILSPISPCVIRNGCCLARGKAFFLVAVKTVCIGNTTGFYSKLNCSAERSGSKAPTAGAAFLSRRISLTLPLSAPSKQ